MDLVIASNNSHKVRELRAALGELAPFIQVLSLYDFPSYKPSRTEAVADSFEENAMQKARAAAVALNKITLADDSGIIVPALAKVGAKFTRRYEHTDESATKQTRKLLEEMRSFKDLERQAYLECCLAIATPQGTLYKATSRTEGVLAEDERGKITFEFDTLFIKHDYSKTLGELAPSIRDRISHRRKALEKLVVALSSLQAYQ